MRHFTVKLAVNKAVKLFNNKDDVSKCKNATHRLYCFSDKIKAQATKFSWTGILLPPFCLIFNPLISHIV